MKTAPLFIAVALVALGCYNPEVSSDEIRIIYVDSMPAYTDETAYVKHNYFPTIKQAVDYHERGRPGKLVIYENGHGRKGPDSTTHKTWADIYNGMDQFGANYMLRPDVKTTMVRQGDSLTWFIYDDSWGLFITDTIVTKIIQ